MTVGWDAVVRAWLVITTWLALRRRPSLARLVKLREPMRFVRAAMIVASRPSVPIALAVAMLPRRRRAEASVAFVACRTLHAIDALSADPRDARRRITACIRYFVGEASGPTRLDTRGPRNFDAVLAARLALVRGALDQLPGDAARRCCDVIERLGDGLLRARDDWARYADHARAAAVLYAVRLAAPTVRPPVAACKAAGRVIPLGRELRLAGSERARDLALGRAMPALAFVPRLLRWLPRTLSAGTRAAMILLALTLYPFGSLELASMTPRRLRRPLRSALAAAWSRRSFLATGLAIEEVLHDARAGLVTRLDGPALGSALSQPGTARPDGGMIALALELLHVAPAVPEVEREPTKPRNPVAHAAITARPATRA